MNKKNILRISLVCCILITVLVVSYAFFEVIANVAITDVKVGSLKENDSLTFESCVKENGKCFSISPSTSNLTEGGSSLSSSGESVITLSDSNTSGEAQDDYSLYLNIENNDFIYTTKEKKPELLLRVIDHNGDEIKELPGLIYYENYNSVEGLSGFDVTEYKGIVALAKNRDIEYVGEPGGSISHTWKFTLSMVNLDSNQVQNLHALFEGEIIMRLDEFNTLTNNILINNTVDADGNKVGTVTEAREFYLNQTGNLDFFEYFLNNIKNENLDLSNLKMVGTLDETGKTSFVMGSSENIWLKFGTANFGYGNVDLMWQIIRIDGHDNVKVMIRGYEDADGNFHELKDFWKVEFNTEKPSNNNVFDALYEYPDTTTLDSEKVKFISSNIKKNVDQMYDQILKKDYEKYLTKGTYCIDSNAEKINAISEKVSVDDFEKMDIFKEELPSNGYIFLNSYVEFMVTQNHLADEENKIFTEGDVDFDPRIMKCGSDVFDKVNIEGDYNFIKRDYYAGIMSYEEFLIRSAIVNDVFGRNDYWTISPAGYADFNMPNNFTAMVMFANYESYDNDSCSGLYFDYYPDNPDNPDNGYSGCNYLYDENGNPVYDENGYQSFECTSCIYTKDEFISYDMIPTTKYVDYDGNNLHESLNVPMTISIAANTTLVSGDGSLDNPYMVYAEEGQ